MVAEKEEDPFPWMTKLCKPTASQEAEFPNCALARESEIFLDSNNEPFSSSASQPTGIVVISLVDSVEEDAVLPQHNYSPNELCPEQMRVADATKVRVSEVGLDDEGEMQKVRVEKAEEFDCDIIPLGDTEESEIEGDESAIIVLSSEEDSGTEKTMAIANLDAAGEVSIVREIGGLLSNNNKNHELGENVESTRTEKHSETSAGKSCLKVKLRVRGVDKASKDAKKPKDSRRNGRVSSSGKKLEEIDGKGKGRTGTHIGDSGSKRLKGKETQVVESSQKKSGLFDIVDVLNSVFGDMNGGCEGEEEDVDFLETAKSKGLTFPRPRWWPDDDEEWYSS